MNCSDDVSAVWRMRFLEALAQECARLGAEIARLGDAVSAGDADVVALQGFDAQSQTAHGLCGLLRRLCGPRHEIFGLVAQVPLPAMRRRLQAMLNQDGQAPADDCEDTVIWIDAP